MGRTQRNTLQFAFWEIHVYARASTRKPITIWKKQIVSTERYGRLSLETVYVNIKSETFAMFVRLILFFNTNAWSRKSRNANVRSIVQFLVQHAELLRVLKNTKLD
jgi:hypothetical protein